MTKIPTKPQFFLNLTSKVLKILNAKLNLKILTNIVPNTKSNLESKELNFLIMKLKISSNF